MAKGWKMNLEQKQRLSEAHKGKHPSEETRRKRSESMKGKNKYKRTNETRGKLSESHKGKPPWNKGKKHSEESIKKMSESHKGSIAWNKEKTASEETKRKLSLAHLGIKYPNRKHNPLNGFQKGHKFSEETLGKMSNSLKGRISPMKGKHPSEETIKKQSESLRKTLSNPEARKRLSEATKRGMANPEVIKKMKEHRAKQIFPLKDSKPEIKIQNFLKSLGITFLSHKHIKEIKHGYQCDILIPSMNLIIECDGDYWHGNINNPRFKLLNKSQLKTKEIDINRTKELLEKGFKVLRLWESDINKMTLNDFMERLKPFDKMVN